MNLKDKLVDLKHPEILPFADGYDDTIKDFFEDFVKPRLPKEKTIREWHKLLMDYTDEKNYNSISCCVRYGNNGSESKSKKGEVGYYKLRRGWVTKNTKDDFNYFFADNFFSSFIYKMALDGFCPELDDFKNTFDKHLFPYGFGYKIDKKINEYKGSIIPTAQEPGFLGKYKLSHVFDSGENFSVEGTDYPGKADKKLSELYYDIGHTNDYLCSKDKIRRTFIDDVSKKVIIAKFLRFAHPFNYFLTPSKKLHHCITKVSKNDIGEDPRMISYVKLYLSKTYPVEYKEFVDRILWYENPLTPKEDGTTLIKISYSPIEQLKTLPPSKSPHPKKTFYLDKDILNLVKTFLENRYTYKYLDDIVLKCPTDRHGNTSWTILNKLGISKDKKGILTSTWTIDDELKTATGIYKQTLINIKKEFNL